MSSHKHRDLLVELAARTKDGRIQWEESMGGAPGYQVVFPNYVLRLAEVPSSAGSRSEADSVDYVLQIMNEKGDTIDKVTDTDFEPSLRAYETMRDMYETARRQALGVEQALDDILAELNELKNDDLPF